MTAGAKRFSLDISFELGESLLAPGALHVVQELLRELAPSWTAGLHVWRYRDPKRYIDVRVPGELATVVKALATERGAFYEQLVARFGSGSKRACGSAELRGVDDVLTAVMTLDELIFTPIGETWSRGNSLCLQIRRSRVEGIDAAAWAATAIERICEELQPHHAHAEMSAEYQAKNISTRGGGVRAVGVDASRSLPGLYWANFLGRPYVDLIGRERLLAAPAERTCEIGSGVLLLVDRDPRAWETAAYRSKEKRILDELGRQYFFSIDEPDRKTIAPDFGLTTQRRRELDDI